MDNEAFLKDLAEILEVEPTDLKDQFELSPDIWDSLVVVSTIVLVDEHFDVTVDGGELTDCSSIGTLLERIQQRIAS